MGSFQAKWDTEKTVGCLKHINKFHCIKFLRNGGGGLLVGDCLTSYCAGPLTTWAQFWKNPNRKKTNLPRSRPNKNYFTCCIEKLQKGMKDIKRK